MAKGGVDQHLPFPPARPITPEIADSGRYPRKVPERSAALPLRRIFCRVQRRGLADERHKCPLANVIALVDVDAAPRSAIEARVEEPRRVLERGAMHERQLDLVLVDFARADDAVVRPCGHAGRVGRFRPLRLFDRVRIGFANERADTVEGLAGANRPALMTMRLAPWLCEGQVSSS